jgi:hypothetical protein
MFGASRTAGVLALLALAGLLAFTVAPAVAAPLPKSGSFTDASRGQCEKARRLSVRKHREEVRQQHAEERRELDEELARDRLYEANCRKVGGKPVTIQTNEGPEIVCRSQTGGIVEA